MLVFPSFSTFPPEKPSWWCFPSGVSLSVLPGSAVRINGSPPWLHIRNTQRAFRYYCLHLTPRIIELQSLGMGVGRITVFSKSSLMTLVYDQGKELLAYALHSALNCFSPMSASFSSVALWISQGTPLLLFLPFFLLLYFLSLQDMSGFYGLHLSDLPQDTFICPHHLSPNSELSNY